MDGIITSHTNGAGIEEATTTTLSLSTTTTTTNRNPIHPQPLKEGEGEGGRKKTPELAHKRRTRQNVEYREHLKHLHEEIFRHCGEGAQHQFVLDQERKGGLP